jgi:hypothetical protein
MADETNPSESEQETANRYENAEIVSPVDLGLPSMTAASQQYTAEMVAGYGRRIVPGVSTGAMPAKKPKVQINMNDINGNKLGKDLRVKIMVPSNYLTEYTTGLADELGVSNLHGIVFPYTPSISTVYRANYTDYNLTHSNYKGYFYQSSHVDPINISCMFTAQGTAEANYLLAVIHFFRSATKMFYGQDAQRGSPPPLVYLTGLGEYQFNEHPLVISSFDYSLPSDIDYIRAGSPNNVGLNLTNQRDKQKNVDG